MVRTPPPEIPLSPRVKPPSVRWAIAGVVSLPVIGLAVVLLSDNPVDDPVEDWLCETPDTDVLSSLDDLGHWLLDVV